MLKGLENINLSRGERVVVAMSGGVDSSVSALIARDAGLDVVGITLKMFNSDKDIFSDAKAVADKLGVEWYGVDYTERFNTDIISYFIREYKFGRTPNPCTRCNRISKTQYLFEEMANNNASRIITGHYAKIEIVNEQSFIKKSSNTEKDQSYYLSLIEPSMANYLRFPLGDYDKSYVRKIASDNMIKVHDKDDSQDICFLEGIDYREFLHMYNRSFRRGKFILDGVDMGENKGIENYTVGQRRGLEISYSEPLYVKSIDPKTGDVYLSKKTGIYEREVNLVDCNFYPNTPSIANLTAKLRYRMNDEKCILERLPDNKAKLLFDEPQFAPARGQTATIYMGDIVIGGGIID